ncbi:putative transcriptional regulator [uncultured Pleomorphomonas sp.]|uniref:Putative transcriptional regulator n=1 Tax=uncultured Pleomorphomonas sp. TaxID=442121 RepID=A0A212LBH5_9HYPH|nr:DJ-1/PfpI family protein [uncultured Pleomorphomonas sp.]SCM74848.1 putative transcriptional regulator [uncultured Pleomorphomonas sp.]
MNPRSIVWGALGLAALSAAGLGVWLATLPPAPVASIPPPVPREEIAATLAALKPPKRQRPLAAIVGLNDATETTDYLLPYGVLKRANVADVVSLATGPGPVRLFPALVVQPDATIAAFDAAHPEGADYVIVPAMSRDDDPAVIAWLGDQAEKGATIIGICAGAKIVAAAGLLDGKRATTHWYYLDEMLKRSPTIEYVADRRLVSDAGVTTTTGITASMPMMLTLIEAIAGRARAEAVARDLGLETWDTRHASGAFGLTRPFATTVFANRLAVWNREELGVRLEPGMDEVSLALVADAWSRTYRSNATTYAASPGAVESRNGVRIIPDRSGIDWPADRRVSTFPGRKPADALDHALDAIAGRYGARTSNVVAMQLEYPRQ